MAVVKADAYGHGAVPVAKCLAAVGVDWFGAATAEEALELRAAGIEQPILLLGGL
jgi:alanine racemase